MFTWSSNNKSRQAVNTCFFRLFQLTPGPIISSVQISKPIESRCLDTIGWWFIFLRRSRGHCRITPRTTAWLRIPIRGRHRIPVLLNQRVDEPRKRNREVVLHLVSPVMKKIVLRAVRRESQMLQVLSLVLGGVEQSGLQGLENDGET